MAPDGDFCRAPCTHTSHILGNHALEFYGSNQLPFSVAWLLFLVYLQECIQEFCMSLCTMLFFLILFVTSLHSRVLRGHLHIFYVCEASHCSGSTTVYFSKLLSMFIWVVFHSASLNKIYQCSGHMCKALSSSGIAGPMLHIQPYWRRPSFPQSRCTNPSMNKFLLFYFLQIH